MRPAPSGQPRHYHQLDRPGREVTARVGERVVARSCNTVMLKEVGTRVYDPVYYFPPSDVELGLFRPSEKVSHCPIKGDAEYFSFESPEGLLPDLAWYYPNPIEYSREIAEMVAFDPSRVSFELGTSH